MVEILVVILVICILALIALPAFLRQRAMGQDADAKLVLRTATTAMALQQIAHDTFDVGTDELVALEPSLKDAADFAASGTEDTYELSVASSSGTTFKLERDAAETITRTCSRHGRGLCHEKADAQGNWW